jgi:CheY-like chemotaxis protein
MTETRRMCVLLVEDEAMLRDLVVEEFEERDIDVLAVDNGEAALSLLNSDQPIDVLFTDIRLPGSINGWKLAERARAARPDIRVIYATGYPTDPKVQLPNTVYISKPYRASLIAEQVRRWSKKESQSSEAAN